MKTLILEMAQSLEGAAKRLRQIASDDDRTARDKAMLAANELRSTFGNLRWDLLISRAGKQ